MEDLETGAAEPQSDSIPVALDPTAAADQAAKVAAAEAVVNSWLTQHIYGSAVAQHTPAYNHLVTTLDALKAEIAAIL